MASKYKRYHPQKWAGVYVYELSTKHKGKNDLCFFINYRLDGRLQWEKIGKISEGYSAEVAAEIRSKRLRAARHGEEVKTTKELRQERAAHDRLFGEIAHDYFDSKKSTLKGFTSDINRYEKHLKQKFEKLSVSKITSEMIENLKSDLSKMKAATVWNILELFRRIINFGFKTNRCSQLTFQIEMPKKDNTVVEYLTPVEVNSFFTHVKNWPVKDVANMLLLAFFTGMRRGEIFKLETTDIDFHMNIIKIRDPKGGKNVTISMNKASKEIIEAQMAWRAEHFPDSPYLFPGKNGAMRKECKAANRIKRAAGLPETFRPFHGLRHHFAVTLANSGEFSLDLISEMLTHKNPAFTKKVYGQFLPDTMLKASEKASKILLPDTIHN